MCSILSNPDSAHNSVSSICFECQLTIVAADGKQAIDQERIYHLSLLEP